MRLAGDDDLDRPLGAREDADQTLWIVQEEGRALVAGESTGKAECQGGAARPTPTSRDTIKYTTAVLSHHCFSGGMR